MTIVQKVKNIIEKDKIRIFNIKKIYIVPSTSDSEAYWCVRILNYDTKNSKWLISTSFPDIDDIYCLYVPPKEYAMLPDSLKSNKLPF
jgi:hypothetical protein